MFLHKSTPQKNCDDRDWMKCFLNAWALSVLAWNMVPLFPLTEYLRISLKAYYLGSTGMYIFLLLISFIILRVLCVFKQCCCMLLSTPLYNSCVFHFFHFYFQWLPFIWLCMLCACVLMPCLILVCVFDRTDVSCYKICFFIVHAFV